MKFRGKKDGVNSGALQIGGEGVKFAASVGQVAFIQLVNDNAAAFNANFQAVKSIGSAAQAIVGLIEAVEHARVRGIVEPLGAEMKIESAECLGSLDEERVFRSGAIAIRRGSDLAARARLGSGGTIVVER